MSAARLFETTSQYDEDFQAICQKKCNRCRENTHFFIVWWAVMESFTGQRVWLAEEDDIMLSHESDF